MHRFEVLFPLVARFGYSRTALFSFILEIVNLAQVGLLFLVFHFSFEHSTFVRLSF